ncbi:hypothetical protein Pmani_031233 [Petrolisthes manimaculis]|uniref:Uncharacterized protein n=1 Tax=Petrolisthes manimaculis TaxID=1843537 RepID=A0AAE1NVT0_9EUCA|nr:hypothetical protein Pmani_031233 [Petrolisthes manimaculis]
MYAEVANCDNIITTNTQEEEEEKAVSPPPIESAINLVLHTKISPPVSLMPHLLLFTSALQSTTSLFCSMVSYIFTNTNKIHQLPP